MTSITKEPARILVVDDDPSVLRVVERVLRRAGYTVETATDGIAATELIRFREVDVILSDVDMPGMDGVGLLRVVRERGLDVPVLLFTGKPAVSSAVQAVEHGALRYLLKPLDVPALLAAVSQGVAAHEEARQRRAETEKVRQAAGERTQTETRFANALDTLWMAYQPIVGWPGGATYAREALVRNREPTLLAPPDLFTVAEELGRLNQIGRAIRASVARTAAALPDERFFVNLHPRDLTDPELLDPAAPLSAMAGRVVLEITERAALDELGDVREVIAGLRRMGYRIAVDDLGAGYAGLSSFAQLHPEVVKIDASLVRDCDTSPTKLRVCATVAKLCRELDLLLVAEGVETEGERDALARLGVELLQGYLFARPQPIPLP